MSCRSALVSLLVVLLSACAGCWSSSPNEVVVYTAQDAQFAEPIFKDFTAHSGVTVLPKWDTESTKTVGLVETIFAEAKRPRCDVFWNNEVLHSVRLSQSGLVEVYRPKLAGEYPAAYRAADGTWHGFAARARVLLVNTNLVADKDRPKSIHDLADRRWRGKVGIAKPLFGTTATHAACLFAVWGERKAEAFFGSLQGNVSIMAGNKHVATAVGAGQLAFGLTDTDDAIAEVEAGRAVVIVYPDQQEGGLGTLFIPNTLVVIKECPHPEAAHRLVDYLLTPQVEAKLAAGPAAQIPLHPDCPAKPRVESPQTVWAMQVDFSVAAEKWPPAAKFLRERFTAP